MPDPSPHLYVRSIAIAAVGGRRLLLALTSDGATSETFAASLLPGPSPLNLTALLKQFLTTAFHVDLPAFLPDFAIDTISGTVVHVKEFEQAAAGDPPAHPTSSYSLAVGSRQLVGAPFGSTVPISLRDFTFSIGSAAGAPAEVIATAQVVPGPSVSSLPATDAQLILTSGGGSVVGFEITSTVQSKTLITDVLGLPLSGEVADLLPAFSPASPTSPMRIYRASEALSLTIAGEEVQFLKGFNVDDVVVTLLDNRRFAVTLQVERGFVLSASLEALDLGFVTVTDNPNVQPAAGANLGGPLINVTDQTPIGGGPRSSTVSLASQLTFFNDEALTFPVSLSYTGSTKTFAGTVSINQTILGAQIGDIGVAWDKQNGFRFTEFPIPFSQLSTFIDFGKEIYNYYQNNPGNCGPIPNIAFKNLIQTTFTIAVAPSFEGGQPGVKVTGSYLLQVTGYEVATIDFQPVIFSFDMPGSFNDLGQVIVNGIKDNAATLVDALIADKDAFMKFLGLVSLTKATEAAFNEAQKKLTCHLGRSNLKTSIGEAGSSAAGSSGAGAMPSLPIAAAASIAAGAAISFFDAILDCLTDEQKKEKAKAEARQRAADAAITSYLQINDGITATYGISGGQIVISVAWVWGDPSKITGDTKVVISAGGVTVTSPALPASATITLPAGAAGQTTTVSIKGRFSYENSTFYGAPRSADVVIPALAVVNPGKTYDSTANSLTVQWDPTPAITPPNGPKASVTSYTVELRTVATNILGQPTSHPVPGMTATISAGSSLTYTFDLVPTSAPLFWPDPQANYGVWISLASTVPVLNAPPWQSETFQLPGGVGHTLVGLTFTVGAD